MGIVGEAVKQDVFKTIIILLLVIVGLITVGWFLSPEQPIPIEQNWIDEATVCYMQGSRAINCETMRIE
jgi:hypothetical protein